MPVDLILDLIITMSSRAFVPSMRVAAAGHQKNSCHVYSPMKFTWARREQPVMERWTSQKMQCNSCSMQPAAYCNQLITHFFLFFVPSPEKKTRVVSGGEIFNHAIPPFVQFKYGPRRMSWAISCSRDQFYKLLPLRLHLSPPLFICLYSVV